jgi:hypothetical protein
MWCLVYPPVVLGYGSYLARTCTDFLCIPNFRKGAGFYVFIVHKKGTYFGTVSKATINSTV